MCVLVRAGNDVFQARPTASAIQNVRGKSNDSIDLKAGQISALEGDNRWRLVVCVRGEIWVTQEQDLEDYVLAAGEMLVVNQRGKVVIGAREDASVEITPSLRKAPYRGRFQLLP